LQLAYINMQLVYINIGGSQRISFLDCNKYYITFIDDYIPNIFGIFFFKSKNEVTNFMKI